MSFIKGIWAWSKHIYHGVFSSPLLFYASDLLPRLPTASPGPAGLHHSLVPEPICAMLAAESSPTLSLMYVFFEPPLKQIISLLISLLHMKSCHITGDSGVGETGNYL